MVSVSQQQSAIHTYRTKTMKTSPRSIILLLLTTALAALLSSSCRGTINGVGHDVERAGHNIHQAVN